MLNKIFLIALAVVIVLGGILFLQHKQNTSPDNSQKALNSQNEAALKPEAMVAVNNWLIFFQGPSVLQEQRLKAFVVSEIKIDIIEENCMGISAKMSLEPAQAPDISSYWMAGGGRIEGTWVKDKILLFNAAKKGEGYEITGNGTSRVGKTCSN